ncbi:hypothetical protein BOTBODRAFT_55479 [Botryobasidium botryosum FD-172 SS1]|uniref:Uncharacterized protein n=1 Tax=Botryobasidium botryosum (strain FD-172 SS1) TaxID=930990 RepID=A0A067MF12_BOTB1|nr:hypothetical protein BOTBODRAFT_55479 [Botryobasidium botryosum FD-172 SS1]
MRGSDTTPKWFLILPPPRNRAHVTDYGRAVSACLKNTGLSQYMQLSVRIPIYVPSEAVAQADTGSPARQDAPALFAGLLLGQSVQSAPTELDLASTREM